MTPRAIRSEVVLERAAWVRKMLDAIGELPLDSIHEFTADKRNPAAAESFLRRALEALLDLGRHIVAKGFGEGVVEYKEVARRLVEREVISPEAARLLAAMGGYRNRLTHLYHEVTHEELFRVCSRELGDVDAILEQILGWLRAHPELLDSTL